MQGEAGTNDLVACQCDVRQEIPTLNLRKVYAEAVRLLKL